MIIVMIRCWNREMLHDHRYLQSQVLRVLGQWVDSMTKGFVNMQVDGINRRYLGTSAQEIVYKIRSFTTGARELSYQLPVCVILHPLRRRPETSMVSRWSLIWYRNEVVARKRRSILVDQQGFIWTRRAVNLTMWSNGRTTSIWRSDCYQVTHV